MLGNERKYETCLMVVFGTSVLVDSNSDKILNVAGYWTLGIAKGVAMVFVPIMFMGLAAGFTMKVAQTAARVGGMK